MSNVKKQKLGLLLKCAEIPIWISDLCVGVSVFREGDRDTKPGSSAGLQQR